MALVAAASAVYLLAIRNDESKDIVSATLADGSQIPSLSITPSAEDDRDLRVGSIAQSPVMELTSAPFVGAATVRFAIPEELKQDEVSRLAVAHRGAPDEMWTLHSGRPVGDRQFAVTVDHFSQMQLRMLTSAAFEHITGVEQAVGQLVGVSGADPECTSTRAASVEVESTAHGDPFIAACVEETDHPGQFLVRLANKGSVGLSVQVPSDSKVRRVSGRGLSDTFWEAAYGLVGEDSVLLPGAGGAEIEVDGLPAEIGATADNASIVTDALMLIAGKGGTAGSGSGVAVEKVAEFGACVHSLTSDSPLGETTIEQFTSELQHLWRTCGEALSGTLAGTVGASVFDGLKIAKGVYDSFRAISGHTNRLKLSIPGGGSIRPASDEFVFRYDMRWRLGDGEEARGVVELEELQPLEDAAAEGFENHCYEGDESRAAVVHGRFDITNETDGFDVEIVPMLLIGSLDPWGLSWTRENTEEIVQTRETCVIKHGSEAVAGGQYLQPGETYGPVEFWVIYGGVLSPGAPQGDPTFLESLVIALEPHIASGLRGIRLMCISGVGVGVGPLIPVGGGDVEALVREYDLEIEEQVRLCS